MEKAKKVQSKQQQPQLLKEYSINLDLKDELKNIINKDNQYTIPVFIPHLGCNNECVFCNQRKITGLDSSVSVDDVDSIIKKNLEYFENNSKDKKIEIAFFGGSFTGISINKQIEYLEIANKYLKNKSVDSIRLSTRPDYISPKILKMLKKYNVGTIELGVQSMDENVLLASKRGHDKKDVIRASRLIRLYNIDLGIQLMVGLPESNLETEITTIKKVLKLKPRCLRIYPVYVLKDSKLYDMYLKKVYIPLSITEAVNRVYYILKECQKTDVKVIRIGLQSTTEITSSNSEIVGPVCDNFAEYAMAKIILSKLEDYTRSIKNTSKEEIVLNVNVPSRYISVVIGPKKINKLYLKDKYNVILKVKGEDK